MSIFDTPCRKKRDVPLAKGDKASFLAPEMYKLQILAFGLSYIISAKALNDELEIR